MAGALVALRFVDPETYLDALVSTSSRDGVFRLSPVLPGRYTLRAESPDFVVSAHGQQIDVGDRDLGGVEIRLDRGGTIFGQIDGVEGHAPRDLHVEAMSPESDVVTGRISG
ncbi:MAG: carboxypeptidase-like regulatory domain-containing protein [Thermoanaerobaculia bacterium]|nr:carboxypeptidase-like regulatory domain-containing protein [Thermoanaerobaculia bacterium]